MTFLVCARHATLFLTHPPHTSQTTPTCRPPQVEVPLYEPNTLLLVTAYPHLSSLWGTPKPQQTPAVLGRLRVRLSAMPADQVFTVKLPLVSDRSGGAVRVVGHAVMSMQVRWC